MGFYVVQFLTGLAGAASLFLVACGLSLVFGVTRVVNFAHGSFYMLGAFVAYSLTKWWGAGLGFWAALVASSVIVGALGAAIEVLLLRRLYRSPELYQLVATFGVLLVVQDAALALWGPDNLLGPRAPGLSGSVALFGQRVPQYDLFLIVLGPTVLLLLTLLLTRTRWGRLVRAATEDRDMAAALGVNQRHLFTAVFFLGSLLAALGGALQLPRAPATLFMDLNIIAEAFVVVVVGGMGSIFGAFLAAVLIAELHAFGILIFPQVTIVLVFVVMAVVLVVRPWGLLGRPEDARHRTPTEIATPLGVPRCLVVIGLIAVAAVLMAWPAMAGDYGLKLATEVLVFALFAASLNFILGVGGMISFGHAAYLGLGAYGAALLVSRLGWPMEAGLVVAPLAAGFGALLFGWFCVRLSGVYLAMLSLAFAQIAWSVAFQWYDVTGGDNGIQGVWPSAWATSPLVYYYLALAVVAAALFGLHRVASSPFGYALRAARDSSLLSEAIGIDVKQVRWFGFALAGAAAGMAGGLYAFLKGNVSPTVMAIPVSIDGLVMVLLGGVQTVVGPLLGAATLVGLKTEIASATNVWRGVLGALIIGLALLFPRGIVGHLGRWHRGGRP